MPGILLASLIAAAVLPPADQSAVDQAVAEIFAPYTEPETDEAPWDRPIYSQEVSELIDEWQDVTPENEPDALSDGDWFCQCQEWDPEKFGISIVSHKASGPDEVEVTVDIDTGAGEMRGALLSFRRENGDWMLDDLFSKEHADGIKAALRQTIADDEVLQEPIA